MKAFLLKLLVTIGAVLITVSVAAGIAFAESYVSYDFNLQLKEAACVQWNMDKGTPRENIKTDNGKCWIEWG